MGSKTLKEKLGLLDFEDSPVSGLLFTDREYKSDPNVSFDERLILRRAKELNATAVYFRRIEGRSSVPQLFIYDNSNHALSDKDFVDIHRKIWSSGIVPLYYVFDQTEVKIFNSRKSIKWRGEDFERDEFGSLALTALVHDKYKFEDYSAMQFRNGNFWELADNRDEFKADSSSSKKLIDGLRKIRAKFSEGQNETACNKLLVLSILVKYLEERKDSKGTQVLSEKYFQRFEGAKSFCEVLRKGKGIDLFEDLGGAINGGIFALSEQEKKGIAKLEQSRLADFLDAKLDKHQYVFWRLYDFNCLPVELISRIYEEFIPKRKDVAYTPPHLVDFMIDECMPIDSPEDNYKVIDVSCGSGIFLVAAFKRIMKWWQSQQYKKTGKLKTPTIRTLKSLLRNSIYGLDIEGEAVRLAIFSLTIALCEMLDPAKMWDELTQEKLLDLSENIIKSDFFDFVQTRKKYDLVIGNPPFNLPFEEKEEKEKYWDETAKKITIDYEVPDKNIALLFLQQGMKLLKNDGLLSLVLPSGPLLYNNGKTFTCYRTKFLEEYNVPQIFDFSRLKLFAKSSIVSILFAENKKPNDKDILHAVVQRTIASKEKLYFEIDKYDLHYVSKELAKSEQLIWKTNYLGGGHLFHLIKRLNNIKVRSLGKYLRDKAKDCKWEVAEGYKVKGKSSIKPEKASWLTGKSWIPTEKFTCDLINDADIEPENEELFERSCKTKKQIFKGPHILIKENPALPVVFRNDYLIFRNEIIGIHAPDEHMEKEELLKLRKNIILNRKLYHALLLSMSGRAGISRSVKTVLKKDIMALPYPEYCKALKLSKAEQIICDDVFDYYIDQLDKGEEATINAKNAESRNLILFGKTFCTSLNSIYKEGNKEFYPLDPIEAASYICYPFAYGTPEKPNRIPKTKADKIATGNLDCLIDNFQERSVLYKRIIKLYDGKDMVYLIKPKSLRYWLKSIALRDANEVFTDLVSSGY